MSLREDMIGLADHLRFLPLQTKLYLFSPLCGTKQEKNTC